MSTCMTLGQAANWLGQTLSEPALREMPILRVHTDTRSLQHGDLFVALKGERFDANTMLAQAKAGGAVAALVQGGAAFEQMRSLGLPGFMVDDTRVALGQLAKAHRAQFALPLIAVTGSNGKTTVTQMLAAILRAHAGEAALATEGNFNNDIGVPLTLLRLRATHHMAVVELGMNHPGEIAVLSGLARPTVALVNNAQREHQEFMSSVKAVAAENGSVISALPPEGVAVFPADDEFVPMWRGLAGARRCVTFAGADHAGALVYPVRSQWMLNHWQLDVHAPQGLLSVRLNQAGAHNVKNAMAAIACALAAGLPIASIEQGLARFEPVKGRSRALALQYGRRALTLIDDSYNANPDSVRAAIDVLASLPAPRLLVLGDMGEVGEKGPAFHAEVGAYARERGIDSVFCLGTQARHSAEAFGAGQHFTDVEALNSAVVVQLGQLSSLLVKGSRFMRMERVVQAVADACAEAQPNARSLAC